MNVSMTARKHIPEPLSHMPELDGSISTSMSGSNQSARFKEERDKQGVHELSKYVSQIDIAPRYDPERELGAVGKRDVWRQKYGITFAILSVNFFFIFATWWWPKYYYLYLPFITITVALNCIMVFSVSFFSLKHRIFPEKQIIPEVPENLVYLIPCYNESIEECTRSLDSLVAQINIDQHKKAIMIVCDGRVRGPGMEKTTAQYLLEDVLKHRSYRKYMRKAYMAWDHQPMDVEIQKGDYKGIPYFCIVKQQNQGKRDGLILLRSFLYNFNRRHQNPKVIFSPLLFGEMASFMLNDACIDNVDCLIGMDADTAFDPTCVEELLKQSHYPSTVGVCGYVAVDFKGSNFSLWRLYQSSEYTISQGLRRLHQSIATNKVSCLPGCCQLLRICEATCGDKVLVELFGYCPKPTDNMLKHIRATASEDRNHVCLMLSAAPNSKTRQALRARAYTDVPHSWSVFLSQRRRWTLGATSNDLMLITAPGIVWFERILAFANVLTWTLNIFILASLAALIHAILVVPWYIILGFATIMIIPILYYVFIVVWLPRTALERIQYLCGLFLYIFCGPFLNIFVLLFAVHNMDSFGWGKTRKVISTDSSEQERVLDEESQIGLEKSVQPTTSGPEVIAVLGCATLKGQELLGTFSRCYRTIAFDISEEAIDEIRKFFQQQDGSTLETTTDATRLTTADVFLIAAPSLPDRSVRTPGCLYIEDAVKLASRFARPGAVVMVETPVPVGTTRAILRFPKSARICCGYATACAIPNARDLCPAPKILAALDNTSMEIIETVYKRVYTTTTAVVSVEVAEMLQLVYSVKCGLEDLRMTPSALQAPGEMRRLQLDLRSLTARWKALANDVDDGLDIFPAQAAQAVI